MCVCVRVLCWSLSSTAFHILEGVGVSREKPRPNPFWKVLLRVRICSYQGWGLCANDRNQHLENVPFWLAALDVIGVYAQEKLGSRFLMDLKTGLWRTTLSKDLRGESVVSFSSMSGSAAQKLSFMVWSSFQQVLCEFFLWDMIPPPLSCFAEVAVLLWITLGIYSVL